MSNEEFILDIDGSNYSIGAVLSQVQNCQERVISYASRTMNKVETNYCVTDKELLAVKYVVEYFKQYLLGRNSECEQITKPSFGCLKLKNQKDVLPDR